MELKKILASTDITLTMIQPPFYSEEQSRTQDRRIQAVELVMHNDPQLPWTAQELSGLVNLSPSHLRGLFKNEIGQSLSRHLKEVRMRLAMDLLTSQFLSVKEVMNRVGIFSHSHFAKDFKKAHGISPSRVIKSN